MNNEKMKQDAYAAFVADDTKTGWCARSFFNAGWQAALAQQASEPVQFKFPRDPDSESPWVIDFDFLMKVRDLIEDVDFVPCLEDVEEVLRAVEELYPTLTKPEMDNMNIDHMQRRILQVSMSEPDVSQPVAYEVNSGTRSELYYAGWFNHRGLPDNAVALYSSPPDYEALKWKYEGALESIRDHQKIGIELNAKIKNLEELAQDDQETIEALETECKRLKQSVSDLENLYNAQCQCTDEWAEKVECLEYLKTQADLSYETIAYKITVNASLDTVFYPAEFINGVEYLKSRVAELEFENSSIPEHQQIGKEIAAERDALKLLGSDLDKMLGQVNEENSSLKLRVAELESANKSAVRNWGQMVIGRDRLQSENDLLERKLRIALNNVPATVRTRLDMQMAEMKEQAK